MTFVICCDEYLPGSIDASMKLKLDRIISITTLIASLTAIVLVLRRPAPVSPALAPVSVAQPAPSVSTPLQPQPAQQPTSASVPNPKFATPSIPTKHSGGDSETTISLAPAVSGNSSASAGSTPNPEPSSKAHGSADAIGAALAQLLGGPGAAELTPDSNVGSEMPVIKDQQITSEGDVVHGKFLTEIGGKEVWVTISGKMGEKDGYATFDPTEFKVGDTNIPVELVNPELQKKLDEEHERLKIPGNSVQ